MENKTKDTVFSVLMMLLGGYVVFEGVRIVRKAALPPYNITTFSVSPGFLPVILGGALIVFSIILLIKTLIGEKNAGAVFVQHFKTFFTSFVAAFRNPGVLRMIGGVAIMAVLTFILMGLVPFWIGGTLFMIALMFFLRATKWWKILLSSAVAMGLIVLLFQVCFKTTLP
ncbi:MAG: tripartite tricarboxylate transporter TctB family protein [Sphaerochaetaceae bacterium]|nr:tripartite tricarboxylate transporter TctB family protein [Sphaerochaetaceae bacterium]